MADPVEVPRYDLEPADSLGTAYTIGSEPSPTGEACMWDDIAPRLAELADLRDFRDRAARVVSDRLAEAVYLRARLKELEDRTRRRDAATEPPSDGEWVLGQTYRYSKFHPSRRVVVRWVKGYYLDETGVVRHVTRWWPLPPQEE